MKALKVPASRGDFFYRLSPWWRSGSAWLLGRNVTLTKVRVSNFILECHYLSCLEYIFSSMKENNTYYTYILSNTSNSVLYIGVTNNLVRRFLEHKIKINETSFTARYSVHKLVHFECFSSIKDAIAREKQLKTWHRPWKENLIRKNNPTWDDLSPSILAWRLVTRMSPWTVILTQVRTGSECHPEDAQGQIVPVW